MRLTIDKSVLAKALRIVGHAVPGTPSLPVLRNVLLEASAEGQGLQIAATNLEIRVSCQVTANVQEPGAITVPARMLGEIVANMPDGGLALTLGNGQMLTVAGTGRKANIKGIDAEEFPPVPGIESETRLTLDAKSLCEAIAQTVVAAAKDDLRPALSGVLFEFAGDKLTLAGADGYRLAVRELTLPTTIPEHSIIVPAKALVELSRIIDDKTDVLELTPDKARVHCRITRGDDDISSVTLISQLIAGNFPSYRRLIPPSRATRIETSTDELLSALRLVRAYRDAKTAILTMEADTNLLTVKSRQIEDGEGTAEVAACLTGEPLRIGLDVIYLSDALGAITTERVSLEANGSTGPMIIKPVDRDDYVHVIMPMAVAGVQ